MPLMLMLMLLTLSVHTDCGNGNGKNGLYWTLWVVLDPTRCIGPYGLYWTLRAVLDPMGCIGPYGLYWPLCVAFAFAAGLHVNTSIGSNVTHSSVAVVVAVAAVSMNGSLKDLFCLFVCLNTVKRQNDFTETSPINTINLLNDLF